MVKNKIVSGLRGYMLSYLIGMDLMIGNSILRDQMVKEQNERKRGQDCYKRSRLVILNLVFHKDTFTYSQVSLLRPKIK